MKSTRTMWIAAGTVGLLSTLLFLSGFVYAFKTVVYPSAAAGPGQAPQQTAAPTTTYPDNTYIMALGDSLTKGTGDVTGKGYVERVKEGLASDLKKDVFVWNYAKVGAKTADLLALLNDPNGKLTDLLKQANIVLLTIGGNDIFQSGITSQSAVNTAGELNIDYNNLQKEMPLSLDRLDKIISQIATVNPNAHIVYTMFYHPFLDYDTKRAGSTLIQQWSDKAFAIANRYPNVTVVPTYDLFSTNLLKYLYSDHFHPNQEGYARMASRVLQVLE